MATVKWTSQAGVCSRRYLKYRLVLEWPLSSFDKIAAGICNLQGRTLLYLFCLGPDNVLQVGREALADPLFSPISGSDQQAEPGVGDLVADPGPAQGQGVLSGTKSPSAEHTLGEEYYVGAVEDKWQKYRLTEGDGAINKI